MVADVWAVERNDDGEWKLWAAYESESMAISSRPMDKENVEYRVKKRRLGCSCKRVGNWNCAVDQNLNQMVCPCWCHRFSFQPKEK